jgi:hypothetical protein
MKKPIQILLISGLVIVSTIVWLYNIDTKLSIPEFSGAIIIFILAALGILVGIQRWKSHLRGEPAEDELSKRMLQKGSSLAYYSSLYLWLVILYLNDKVEVEKEVLIGSGILGMALLLLACTIVVRIKGLNHE